MYLTPWSALSSLKLARMDALSFWMTALSSAMVFAARTLRMNCLTAGSEGGQPPGRCAHLGLAGGMRGAGWGRAVTLTGAHDGDGSGPQGGLEAKYVQIGEQAARGEVAGRINQWLSSARIMNPELSLAWRHERSLLGGQLRPAG